MDAATTRSTLLARIRDSSDHHAWREFEERYRELLVRFCQRRGLQRADAEDVVQAVFTDLAGTMPRFVYDPARGRFRGYLFRCTRNALGKWARCPNRRARQLELDSDAASNLPVDPDPTPDEAAVWEEEWVAHHYRMALETIRRTYEPRSIAVFNRIVAGASLAECAAEFGMTEEAVRKVRLRVRTRMEELIAQQIREEDE